MFIANIGGVDVSYTSYNIVIVIRYAVATSAKLPVTIVARQATSKCCSYNFTSNQWSPTPRKYVFDVTSIGQHSSPCTCNSVKVEIQFHLEKKLYFPSAQLMLRQMHSKNLSESIEDEH